MTLRGRFGITGSYRKVPGKVPGNIENVPETPEMFRTLSKLYR
jgi:hypothetical protein